MALAATPAINPGHEFHLQRRALELPEQDVHLFARSPIPPVIPAAQQPGGSDLSAFSPELKARIDSIVSIGDKARETLALADKKMESSGRSPLTPDEEKSTTPITGGQKLKLHILMGDQMNLQSGKGKKASK
ncbi:hypothetical protein BDEG_27934 [Batrachochytrium dendrobatidis JEL423]|uniref:Uncharacterized protein n=1 Tax=Batrachochytrium dendrobatidis (strain JEL423) TaxID=403673 RepID=A0A177WXA5_BATDL|nr:hypothetical protein BDEG_27934 [Batrachochytrium dendrobatidis JEL423]